MTFEEVVDALRTPGGIICKSDNCIICLRKAEKVYLALNKDNP